MVLQFAHHGAHLLLQSTDALDHTGNVAGRIASFGIVGLRVCDVVGWRCRRLHRGARNGPRLRPPRRERRPPNAEGRGLRLVGQGWRLLTAGSPASPWGRARARSAGRHSDMRRCGVRRGAGRDTCAGPARRIAKLGHRGHERWSEMVRGGLRSRCARLGRTRCRRRQTLHLRWIHLPWRRIPWPPSRATRQHIRDCRRRRCGPR
mmetsp:Transcript_60212/g.168047  ORF Transcript_60212/g.168047 Transcript_60212/m.168047 type:complete len:205 (+) Transcript_60212:1032-1646(+)